jgi:hypothetical protein
MLRSIFPVDALVQPNLTGEAARIEPLLSTVMRGLDPGLTRASIFLRKGWIAGSSPAMTIGST